MQPTVVSAERIEQLLERLNEQWIRWGRVVVRVPAGQEFCAVLGDGRCEQIADGCGQEMTAKLCPVVNEYWRDTPPWKARHSCKNTDICDVAWPIGSPHPPDKGYPWSAVFVSAIMKQAGFSSTEFSPGDSHADYVVAAREQFLSAYEVVPTPTVALPGDLICSMRNNSTFTPNDIGRIVDGARAQPMHCDIVVRLDRSSHTLEAIGGNVQQAVAKSVVELDNANRVTFTNNPNRRWILVMRARR